MPIFGRERIQQALGDTTTLLEGLVDRTVALMNQGSSLDEIIHTVQAPPELLAQPYLEPLYDEPEFIVRNIWRLYGGWYDGNPANLKPAPDAAVARELATLAGGASRLAARARELVSAGELRLACHMAEYAYLAAPGDGQLASIRADVYQARVESEHSLMARAIFQDAATEKH